MNFHAICIQKNLNINITFMTGVAYTFKIKKHVLSQFKCTGHVGEQK